jgi:hypothetical protein
VVTVRVSLTSLAEESCGLPAVGGRAAAAAAADPGLGLCTKGTVALVNQDLTSLQGPQKL